MTPIGSTPTGLTSSLPTPLLQAIEENDLHHACSLFERWAMEIRNAPERSDRPDDAVVVLLQPWFDFGHRELLTELHRNGHQACLLNPNVTVGSIKGLTESNWKTLKHQGVSIWEVAKYDVCVRAETCVTDIERDPAAWLEALATDYARAVVMIHRVALYLDAFRPSTVLVAQGHILASAVTRALAHARGIRVVAIENTMHSERLLWDDGAALPVVHNRAREHWWRHHTAVTGEEAEAYVASYLERIKELKSSQHTSPTESRAPSPANTDASGATKTILYLGQVTTDASVLFGIGPGFDRQLDVIRTTVMHGLELGHRVVVMLHPKENQGETPLGGTYDRLTLRQMQSDPLLAPLLDHERLVVDADNRFDTYPLIDAADLCVTVNSQAGLEALIKEKELVTCGHAFYGGLGFTHEADDPATLAACIDRVLAFDEMRNVDDKARRFFTAYLSGYCRDKTPATVAELLSDPDSRRHPAR